MNEKSNKVEKKKHKSKKNSTYAIENDDNIKSSKNNISEEPNKPHKSEKKRKTKVQFTPETEDNEDLSPPKKSKKNLEDTRLPTQEELNECKKPENVKNVVSKRQLKRLKNEKLKAETKMKADLNLQKKSLNYLSLWKHNRNEWKFEKLRQVWLQQHIFDEVLLPDDFWNLAVEYFAGCKGKAKEDMNQVCMKIIREYEENQNNEKEENEISVSDKKFNRARTLVQYLE